MKQAWLDIRNGDKQRFITLYDELYEPLFHYALALCKDRELVKECIHLLFCELWETHERLPVDVQNPKFYLFTWLRRILFRQLKSQMVVPAEMIEEPAEASYEDQQIAIEQAVELQQKLQAALSRLTKKQQRYIDLKFFQNKSYEEIAALENAAVRTVYNVIYEAIKSMRGQAFLLLLASGKWW
ncbi:sigma-70 family RNA polymerase sigma factor [Sphingobacterium oryzagri]|uniref:Sigma-70 family RNA polymerase sigma factor n=1 Tax=Sphingobacterium oryzagri TaxID=3025669 RepID=A0ABY7WKD2_9SPHI|nr:sigma-70 family RNA polymerase sigma factor [Sphingobacterium sp. KACC 22765]WDF70051.1 sigma-70 family RNA polymerase sigma factor [Sphingobacterium sp. KACC 22765]